MKIILAIYLNKLIGMDHFIYPAPAEMEKVHDILARQVVDSNKSGYEDITESEGMTGSFFVHGQIELKLL